MPRRCTICSSPNRSAGDAALVSGAANRRLEAQFAVSEQSVRRHKSDHLPATLAKGFEDNEKLRGEDLLGQVEELIAKTGRVLEEAERAGDQKTALAAIRESRGNLELLGKLQGQILQANQININAQANAQAAAMNGVTPGERRDFDPTEFHDILMKVALRQLAERAYNREEEDWHKWMEIDLSEDDPDAEPDLPAG